MSYSPRLVAIVQDKYLNAIEYNEVNISQLIVRVMAVIGKIGELSNEEKKDLAIETVNYMLDNKINVPDQVKQVIKGSADLLIETIYELHVGDLFKDIDLSKVNVVDIHQKIAEHFNFDPQKIINQVDLVQIVSYIARVLDQYDWNGEQKMEIILLATLNFLREFDHGLDLITEELIREVITLIMDVKDGKFTITGKHLSFFKKLFKKCKC